MPIKTEPYIDLLEQLRRVAINSKYLSQRNRMRDNMLRVLLRAFDSSSTYIVSHDFETKESTVRNHYIGSRAQNRELENDLGETYHEKMMGADFLTWLYSDDPQPRLMRIAELDKDDPEYLEYKDEDIENVLFAALHRQDKLWGYIELWDRCPNRQFNASQYRKLQQVTKAISDTLLTEEG